MKIVYLEQEAPFWVRKERDTCRDKTLNVKLGNITALALEISCEPPIFVGPLQDPQDITYKYSVSEEKSLNCGATFVDVELPNFRRSKVVDNRSTAEDGSVARAA